jgi:RES domain-containing protein
MGLTPEITVLEVLVHLNGVFRAPLMLCGYDVPDAPGLIAEADPTSLPERWDAIPHGQASASDGGDWLRAGEQLGLVLPSVVVPQARNVLLNPLHPAMAQVVLVHQEPFQLDARLR